MGYLDVLEGGAEVGGVLALAPPVVFEVEQEEVGGDVVEGWGRGEEMDGFAGFRSPALEETAKGGWC